MTDADELILISCASAVRVALQSVRSGKPELADRSLRRARAQVSTLASGRPAHARIVRNARNTVDWAEQAMLAAQRGRTRTTVEDFVIRAEQSAKKLVKATEKAR